MTQTAYIGIGSNIGDRESNLREAASRLSKVEGTTLRRASSLYYTEPVGAPQPWYFNAVQEVETTLGPEELFGELLRIEDEMGRRRSGLRNAPRIIDLDLLIFGECVIRTDFLTVPHPHLPARRFVLEPLAEISEELVCPGLGATVAELLERLTDPHKVLRKGAFHER